MSAIQMIAIGRKLSNIYNDLCLPICRKYHINQTSFDILLFFANNPEYNTAKDVYLVRGIKSGIASVAIENLIEKDFLIRIHDENDRRKNRLYLTKKSEDIVKEGQKMQLLFAETLKTNITEEELNTFQSLSDKIESNIKLFEKGSGK